MENQGGPWRDSESLLAAYERYLKEMFTRAR